MIFKTWILALALPLALMPQVARGQCCSAAMSDAANASTGEETSSDRKEKKQIDRLLSSERGRALLMEAILRDREFTETLIERIANHPQWRVVARKMLAQTSGDTGLAPDGQMSDRRPAPRSKQERRFQLTADGQGFHPASLTIPAGTPITLVVTRTSDNTCAREIVIPSLDESFDLPLNRPVEIRIPPQKKGSINFACGMNMYRGRLVIN